jgi:hypothetical protein
MCLTDYDVLHLCATSKLCALLHHGFAMPLARKATMILDFITGKSSQTLSATWFHWMGARVKDSWVRVAI